MKRFERDLCLADLIEVLKNDHEEIRRQLWILDMLVSRGDYELTANRADELHTFLGSHFVREKSRVHDILACGSFSSFPNTPSALIRNEEGVIVTMIQKHKMMSGAFGKIHEITSMSLTREEKSLLFDNFERTILDCLKEEEDKDLLPFLIGAIDDEERRRKLVPSKNEDYQRPEDTKIDDSINKQRGEGKEEQEQDDKLVLA